LKVIEAAIGIVVDQQSRVLIAQRPSSTTYQDYWEFPGGKLEQGETAEQALIREFQEEVGLQLLNPEMLFKTCHEYPERRVNLTIFSCNQYEGNATGLEQQQVKWVPPSRLHEFEFLPANKDIIARLHNSLFSEFNS
jgi:8-oxo-dGTP diphosphatase